MDGNARLSHQSLNNVWNCRCSRKAGLPGILLEGLRRLEYRGYDSAGFALIDRVGSLSSHKCLGRVAALEDAQRASPKQGGTGIAHTRWATHGEPSVVNAHPHIINDRIAVVHNGIIENHTALREALAATGRECVSATDTEVVAHLIDAAVSEGWGSTPSGAKCATSA